MLNYNFDKLQDYDIIKKKEIQTQVHVDVNNILLVRL